MTQTLVSADELDALLKEPLDDLNLKSEVATKAFNTMIPVLRRFQQRITDTALVAAQQIRVERARYDRMLQGWKPFLVAYGKANLKRSVDTKTGEIKEVRNHRTVEAGGGVFFATKRGFIDIGDLNSIVHALLEENGYPNLVYEKTVYECQDPKGFHAALFDLSFSEDSGISELAKRYLKNVTVVEDDPYGHFYVGAKAKWTGNTELKQINSAIKGGTTDLEEKIGDEE